MSSSDPVFNSSSYKQICKQNFNDKNVCHTKYIFMCMMGIVKSKSN